MDIRQLRKLVWQYASRNIDLNRFRSQFVSSFLAIRHEDDLNDLVNRIESECADFADEYEDERLLQQRLLNIVAPSTTASSVDPIATIGILVHEPGHVGPFGTSTLSHSDHNPSIVRSSQAGRADFDQPAFAT